MNINDILAFGPWQKIDIVFNDVLVENNEKTEEHIKNIWNKHCQKKRCDYDNKLLRLNSWSNENNNLKLNINTTHYSNYIGTRDPKFKKVYPDGNRADPIGMTIIPITSDGNIIITKRSANMEQNPNKLYFCGGYSEPNFDEEGKINFMNESLREVNEELGIDKVLYFNFIGLAYDPVYCHPELFSTAILDINKDDIIDYWARAKDRDESEELLFLPVDNIENDGFYSFELEATWSYEIGTKLFTNEIINDIKRKLTSKMLWEA